jgi:succinate dehydrogenase / fumarate reductase flavoprotein subunit
MRQVVKLCIKIYVSKEMIELIVEDDEIQGVIVKDLVTVDFTHVANYTVVMLSDTTAICRAYRKGAWFANLCFTQIRLICTPGSGHYQSKLTIMSVSLCNDGQVWERLLNADTRSIVAIPETEKDYFHERQCPSFRDLIPRDLTPLTRKSCHDAAFGNCSNEAECEAYWPKSITIESIARMNSGYLHANIVSRT